MAQENYMYEFKENTPENIIKYESYFPKVHVFGGMTFAEQMTCFEICNHYYKEYMEKNTNIKPTEYSELSILEKHFKFFESSLERIKNKHVFGFDIRSEEERNEADAKFLNL